MNEAVWRPSASLDLLRERAGLLARMRDFFREAGVLEVETPVCSRFGTTDPSLQSLMSLYTGPGAPGGQRLYLQTSPEFPMKRLLAAGSGPIYQICKVFRDGELGRRHNPEFTLLEWYRPGYDHHRLMDEVAALVNRVGERSLPLEKLSYREAFQRFLQLDPHTATLPELKAAALAGEVPGAETLQLDRDGWLDLLLTQRVEPDLGRDRMTFLYDYPASQAALARLRPGNPPVAERFELYLGGIEIANGFHELGDVSEQKGRFASDNRRRREQGLPGVAMDERLLEALAEGLPGCAGVALGIDRLLMYLQGCAEIRRVLAFDFSRA